MSTPALTSASEPKWNQLPSPVSLPESIHEVMLTHVNETEDDIEVKDVYQDFWDDEATVTISRIKFRHRKGILRMKVGPFVGTEIAIEQVKHDVILFRTQFEEFPRELARHSRISADLEKGNEQFLTTALGFAEGILSRLCRELTDEKFQDMVRKSNALEDAPEDEADIIEVRCFFNPTSSSVLKFQVPPRKRFTVDEFLLLLHSALYTKTNSFYEGFHLYCADIKQFITFSSTPRGAFWRSEKSVIGRSFVFLPKPEQFSLFFKASSEEFQVISRSTLNKWIEANSFLEESRQLLNILPEKGLLVFASSDSKVQGLFSNALENGHSFGHAHLAQEVTLDDEKLGISTNKLVSDKDYLFIVFEVSKSMYQVALRHTSIWNQVGGSEYKILLDPEWNSFTVRWYCMMSLASESPYNRSVGILGWFRLCKNRSFHSWTPITFSSLKTFLENEEKATEGFCICEGDFDELF
eukprot:TRINITY_DN11093_c0_g1_i1.p1 TRINITY_DN11093_c0_g1~~TRINITY_DN11093_c0_g1_i1.p1  ORF type:complete len:494 (-),score=96.59 TRINITY_DN11093_c0_g1_i1:102-1505(-)